MLRVISRLLLALFATTLLLVGMPDRHAAAANGITISPAALKLELKKGQQQASTDFSVTNHYQSAVSLDFSIDKSRQELNNNTDPLQGLTASPDSITIMPGETVKVSLTVNDSQTRPPGSQLADLVVSQQSTAKTGVSIMPALRLPVTIIKYDGAVMGLKLASVTHSNFAFSLPASVKITLQNTGNVINIPRGTVTITAPNGNVVGKGILNQQSAAIAPSGHLDIKTPITKLASVRLPGFYKVQVSYGFGEGQAAANASTQFFYLTWWHIAILGLAVVLVWLVFRNYKNLAKLFKRKTPVQQPAHAKRPVLIGRDIS
ncbi:MAG TPA: hypothetical protein VMR45_02975 [Patescibacteria group bacterium]|nr:hypothetical protein [Patescibacteria group bacterium]